MSVSLSAYSLNKTPSTKEFKKFLEERVKDSLKKRCHELQFKQRGKKSLWVGCRGQWKRGCWFYFGENSVCATTYASRSSADCALQNLGISELVKEFGGEIINDSFTTSWTFNKKKNEWEKIEIEYTDQQSEAGDRSK